MRRKLFGMKVEFDEEKIIDQKFNSLKELDNAFNDVKKKLR